MKARNPKLAQYLQDTGALDGSPEDIARAKIAYRKAYKSEHKRQNKQKHHELRPLFTPHEYALITRHADSAGVTPTAYIKAISLNNGAIVPNRELLQHLLQNISMVAIQLEKDSHPSAQQLASAERMLIDYLKKHH